MMNMPRSGLGNHVNFKHDASDAKTALSITMSVDTAAVVFTIDTLRSLTVST